MSMSESMCSESVTYLYECMQIGLPGTGLLSALFLSDLYVVSVVVIAALALHSVYKYRSSYFTFYLLAVRVVFYFVAKEKLEWKTWGKG